MTPSDEIRPNPTESNQIKPGGITNLVFGAAFGVVGRPPPNKRKRPRPPRHPPPNHRLKQPRLFQGEFSRVNSRSEIGNVVISLFHGTPLGSGVMKQTLATPPAHDCFPHRLRMLVVDDPVVEALCACSKAQPLVQVVGTAVGGGAGI
jgi:hypothetical protein